MDQHPYHTLIVGQGLAGTVLAFRLIMAGKKVLVIDPGHQNTSSRIAAGMFTPVSGKRMVIADGGLTKLELAIQLYRELENFLGIQMLHPIPIYHVLASVKEQNDFAIRLEQNDFASLVNPSPELETGIDQPFGAFEVNQAGWMDLPLLLDAGRSYLKAHHALIEESFQYSDFDPLQTALHYRSFTLNKIVFCEGFEASNNPFFKDIEIIPCKGDVLTIHCEQGPKTRIIKKGCYMVEREPNLYRVGSTYKWDVNDPTPHEDGLQTLQSKLDGMLELPYELLDHQAGIRPTTKDRMPIVKQHHQFKNMFMFNGLGTKGVLNAPYWSEKMIEMMSRF